MALLTVFIFGAIVGSFFNVVLLRKNTGESMVYGPSRCFSCGKVLRFWEMVPILSFLALGGKCQYCGSKISRQYPIVEVSGGIMGVLIYSKLLTSNFQLLTSFLFYFASFSALFLISVYDFRNKIIDTHFLYLFGAFSILEVFYRAGQPTGQAGFFGDFISSFFIALFFYLLWRLSGGVWMGRGDANLAFFISLFLGFPKNIAMLFSAFWIGGVFGLALLALGKKHNLKSEIPFGPFLALATFLVWYFPEFFNELFVVIQLS